MFGDAPVRVARCVYGACVAMCERLGTHGERMEHPVVSVRARERRDAGGHAYARVSKGAC